MEVLEDAKGMAKFLKVPESTIAYYVRKKGMPCVQVGKHKRFNVATVMRWIEQECRRK